MSASAWFCLSNSNKENMFVGCAKITAGPLFDQPKFYNLIISLKTVSVGLDAWFESADVDHMEKI